MEDIVLLRAFVRALKLKANQAVTPAQVCEAILLGHFDSSATNGRTIISTAEAGGSISFAIPSSLSPAQIMKLADDALTHIEAQTDPTNPDLPKAVYRLVANYTYATP